MQTRYMEYPVLAGLYQYGSMRIAKAWDATPWLPDALQVAIYFAVVALGLALAWLVTVWATAMSAGRRIWDAALVAASPLVVVHAFTNFDALATAFAAGGLLAWARRRPVLAGVLLGLGAATKLYPLLLLGPLLVLCLRTGHLRSFARTAGAAAAAWLVVNLPIMVLYPRGWAEFFRLNSDRGADPDSIYNVLHSFVGWPAWSASTFNGVSLVLFAAACAAIGWIGLTAPRRPRLAQLCFLLVAAFLLTNKVWSPQYSLWLVPLAVLAVPHRRALVAWMTIDALVWVPRMYYYLGPIGRGCRSSGSPPRSSCAMSPSWHCARSCCGRSGVRCGIPCGTASSTIPSVVCSIRLPTVRRDGCPPGCDLLTIGSREKNHPNDGCRRLRRPPRLGNEHEGENGERRTGIRSGDGCHRITVHDV